MKTRIYAGTKVTAYEKTGITAAANASIFPLKKGTAAVMLEPATIAAVLTQNSSLAQARNTFTSPLLDRVREPFPRPLD
jgi:hypothetical protein